MTETVIITGQDLAVTHDQADDPKRKRPPRFAPSTLPTEFRTIQDVTADDNPYWTDEANQAAETWDGRPIDLARKMSVHRIGVDL